MASPQREHGHVQIANELYSALMCYRFTEPQLVVAMALIRETYGWGRKVAKFPLSLVYRHTGIKPNHATNVLRQLHEAGVFRLEEPQVGAKAAKYSLVKDYSKWTIPLRNKNVSPQHSPQSDSLPAETLQPETLQPETVAAQRVSGTGILESLPRDPSKTCKDKEYVLVSEGSPHRDSLQGDSPGGDGLFRESAGLRGRLERELANAEPNNPRKGLAAAQSTIAKILRFPGVTDSDRLDAVRVGVRTATGKAGSNGRIAYAATVALTTLEKLADDRKAPEVPAPKPYVAAEGDEFDPELYYPKPTPAEPKTSTPLAKFNWTPRQPDTPAQDQTRGGDNDG